MGFVYVKDSLRVFAFFSILSLVIHKPLYYAKTRF